MMSALRWITSWSARRFVTFVLIVIALAAFVKLKQEYDRRAILRTEVPALVEQQDALLTNVAYMRHRSRMSLTEIDGLERPALLRRVAKVRAGIAAMDVPRLSKPGLAMHLIRNDTDAIARDLSANFRLQLLLREETVILRRLAMMDHRDRLIVEDRAVKRLGARISQLDREIADIERRSPFLTRFDRVPIVERFAGPWRELQKKRAELARSKKRLSNLLEARRAFQAAFIDARDIYQRNRLEMISAAAPESALGRAITEKQDELAKNWANWIWDAVEPVLWQALKITALVIIAPPAIKAFWFFILAPFAARLAPVRIGANLAGDISWAGATVVGPDMLTGSGVSRRVLLQPGDELLIKPEYLQSSMN